MPRITQSTAMEVGRILARQKYDSLIMEEKEKLQQLVTDYARRKLPPEILRLHNEAAQQDGKENKFLKYEQISFKYSEKRGDYFYVFPKLPWCGKTVVKLEVQDKEEGWDVDIYNAYRQIQKYKDKKETLRIGIFNTLFYELKTEARVKKEFPEAWEVISGGSQDCELDCIRKELQ